MDLFNDGLALVASQNKMSFERADVSFNKKTSGKFGTRGDEIDLFGGVGALTMVTIELEFRKLTSDSDEPIETINHIFNQNIISAVGNAIRSSNGVVIDRTSAAHIVTDTNIQIGNMKMMSLPASQVRGIEEEGSFTKGFNPCPAADCWIRDYATGMCVPSPTCAQIQCSPDTMFISFKSSVFGLDLSSSPFISGSLFGSSDEQIPTYDSKTDIWSIKCVLGECGTKTSVVNG